MDEFTKKKIEAIEAEISEHCKKVRELDDLKLRYEFQENIEFAQSLVGKYFKKTIEEHYGKEIFHPEEVSSQGHQVQIIGVHARANEFDSGEKSISIYTKETISIRDFKRFGYIEIEKEEFTEILSKFLDIEV